MQDYCLQRMTRAKISVYYVSHIKKRFYICYSKQNSLIMKHYFPINLLALISIILLTISCNKDEQEETTITNPTFIGSLINPGEAELKTFFNEGYSIVAGDVEFSNNMDITNIDKLSNIVEIKGDLTLQNNHELSNMEGLKKLKIVGGNLILSRLFKIENLTGLSSLETVGGAFLMNSLTQITNFQGLNKLRSIQGTFGMENVSPWNEPQLRSTDGLESLEYVDQNIIFKDNPYLTDYCEISDFLINDFKEGFSTQGNFYNPTIEDIRNGDCENDEPAVIILDGIYIQGEGTAITEFDSKGMMSITRNEVTQEDRASLLEKYMAIKGGSEGFNIYVVDNGEMKSYGPGNNFAFVQESDLGPEEPTLGLFRGNITESENPFTVAEDGLYHIAYDTEIGIVSIAKVEWGIIGAATPGGWASSTALYQTFNLSEVQFTLYDFPLTRADYKFRYSNGWRIVLDSEYDLGNGQTGIHVNTNLGGEINNLIPGGNNFVNEDHGKYSIALIWTLDAGYKAEITKTGDIETNDYSETEMGLIGSGIIQNGSPWGWDNSALLHTPVITDDFIYTWTYENIDLTNEGAFKFREGQDWDGLVLGYNDFTLSGESAYDFEGDSDGNLKALSDGIYDFVLVIDALTEEYSLNINPGENNTPKLYIPGAYQGWNPSMAPYILDENNDGIFIGTMEYPAGTEDLSFKFTSEPNWGGINYGTEDITGVLSVDPSAGNLMVPSEGTYLFTVDINNLIWSYQLQ